MCRAASKAKSSAKEVGPKTSEQAGRDLLAGIGNWTFGGADRAEAEEANMRSIRHAGEANVIDQLVAPSQRRRMTNSSLGPRRCDPNLSPAVSWDDGCCGTAVPPAANRPSSVETRRLANDGDAEAQYILGLAYQFGRGSAEETAPKTRSGIANPLGQGYAAAQ